MGLLNFIWDASQDSKINELTEKVQELEEKVEILYAWIQYLKDKDKNVF